MNALASLGVASPVSLQTAAPKTEAINKDNPELKKAFTDFVGQTFFGQMLSSLRSTVEKPAYFHGGQGEEMFQKQLDQILSEKLAETSAENFAGPMYDLFRLQSR